MHIIIVNTAYYIKKVLVIGCNKRLVDYIEAFLMNSMAKK